MFHYNYKGTVKHLCDFVLNFKKNKEIALIKPFLDFTLLNKHYDKILGGISKLTGDKTKIRKIDEASLPLWFALLEKTKSDTTQLNRSLAGGLTSGLHFFVKSCEQNGIETLQENRYPPAQYKLDYLNFV